MNRLLKTTLLTALAAASIAGVARAQSTTSDPLGINAIEDTSIARQRGALQGGTNSGLGALPDSFQNRNSIGGFTFNGSDIFLPRKETQE